MTNQDMFEREKSRCTKQKHINQAEITQKTERKWGEGHGVQLHFKTLNKPIHFTTGPVTPHLQVSNDAVVLWSVQTAGGRGGQLRRSTHHQVTERRVAEAIGTLVLEIQEVLEVLELS